MPIVRVIKNKKHPYLLMNKAGLNDPKLSFKATGLLAYLLSKPDNWFISYKNLISSKTDGQRSVTSAFKELLNYGYISKTQLRDQNGQYGHYYYSVYEIPQFPIPLKYKSSPKLHYRNSVNPNSDNRTLLINKNKKLIKTTTTLSSLHSKSTLPIVDVHDSSKQKTETKNLLNELNIKNHKKLFVSFELSNIFSYASWIKERNFNMKNPTGFLITAIREKWMDQESIDNTKGLRVFFQECSVCGTSFAYEEYEPKFTKCINCRK
ncbi:MAG: hypothetical protein GH151_02725 [Bacteroidetes bacterium]|nr:hypothetical protein [Bacteroidota bacterium]